MSTDNCRKQITCLRLRQQLLLSLQLCVIASEPATESGMVC